MRRELFQEVEIPEGVEVIIVGNLVSVKGKEGENKRHFDTNNLIFEKKGNNIVIGNKNASKREKKMMNTTAAHIKNMIKGVQEKYQYELKACASHFPITVELKGSGALVKNFLGEKNPRKVVIPAGVEVKIDRDFIIINSTDKELAGKAAANFEIATRITGKDRRVFQDGIFITKKAGVEI
jgi:large subunit ribosomal protein L6